jgi:hypothetical protein
MAFGSFEVGVIQRTPVPAISKSDKGSLANLAHRAWSLKRSLDTRTATSHAFTLPALLQVQGGTLTDRGNAWIRRVRDIESELEEIQEGIDSRCFDLYRIEQADRAAITQAFTRGEEVDGEVDAADEADEVASANAADLSLTADLVSWTVGVALGRFDIRIATRSRALPPEPDPFAPLPVCSPGMLQGPDGLPLTDPPEGYPLRVNRDGILVDEPEHPDDIVRRIRDVLELLWKDRAEAIEREACEILSVGDLRDYVRKPGNGGMWMDHVSRYSKSRRKAPIYWLLQSSKKNYALWLYYHRLDKDILFKALWTYVEPKLRKEESRLNELRSQKTALGAAAKGTKKLDKDIERQEALLSELRHFEDKLRRAANLHLEPDLNDGVVLNIAPLWELVPWKEAKAYSDDLMKGRYEWSSIGEQLRAKGIVQ